jgi:hypothetical protein
MYFECKVIIHPRFSVTVPEIRLVFPTDFVLDLLNKLIEF